MMVVGFFTIFNILAIASSLPTPVKEDEGNCISMTPEKQKQFKFLEKEISELLLKLENEIGDIVISDVSLTIKKYTEEEADKDLNFNVSVNECAEENISKNPAVEILYFEEPVEEKSVTEKSKVTEETKVSSDPKIGEGPKVSQEPKVDEGPKVTQEPKVSKGPIVSQDPKVDEGPKVTQEPKVSKGPKVSWEPNVSEKIQPLQPKTNEGPIASEKAEVSQIPKVTKEPKPSEESKVNQEPKISEEPKPSKESKENPNASEEEEESIAETNNSKETNYSVEFNSSEGIDANEDELFEEYEDIGEEDFSNYEDNMYDTYSDIDNSSEEMSQEKEDHVAVEDKRKHDTVITTSDENIDDVNNKEQVPAQSLVSKPGVEVVIIKLDKKEEEFVNKRGNKPFLLIEHGAGKREIRFF